jgi:hypothetical protein
LYNVLKEQGERYGASRLPIPVPGS